MSLKTITKFVCIVISVCTVWSCANYRFGSGEVKIDPNTAAFDEPVILARIESPEITESSGIAVSSCRNDTFWTHNDSGDGPFVYAFDSLGKSLGIWKIPNATNFDWEDMAEIKAADGRCILYIGEIGDNELKRDVHVIYRIEEPFLSDESASSSREKPLFSQNAEVLKFNYPNGRNNAESLLVHPVSGEMYVVTKRSKGSAEVFHLNPEFGRDEIQTASKIDEISLPDTPSGVVTGGDISPDGKHLVLCDYYAGFEFTLPQNAKRFDEIWNQRPVMVNLGARLIGEAVAYGATSDILFATSEGSNAPLIKVNRKN
ncbi:MAG: hypothetical protein ACRD6X_04165 [Pyrinomonadaceae bacterium]